MPSSDKPGDGKTYPVLIVTRCSSSASARRSTGARRSTPGRGLRVLAPGRNRKDPFGQGVEEYCRRFKSEEGRCTGGAGKFLTAIASEMIRQLAAKFPMDTAQLGLCGLSAGGFFPSWAIFQPNSPFKKDLISTRPWSTAGVTSSGERRVTPIDYLGRDLQPDPAAQVVSRLIGLVRSKEDPACPHVVRSHSRLTNERLTDATTTTVWLHVKFRDFHPRVVVAHRAQPLETEKPDDYPCLLSDQDSLVSRRLLQGLP